MTRPQPKPSSKFAQKPKPQATKPRKTATKAANAAKPAPQKRVKPTASKTATAKAPHQRSTRSPASPQKPLPVSVPTTVAPSKSKQAQLIALLRSTAGASMAQMTALTQWQSHTVRGAISAALRKRLGLNVQFQLEEGVRIYRIQPTPAA